MYDGCTRTHTTSTCSATTPEQFPGAAAGRVPQSVAAEGVPASGGYSRSTSQPFLNNALERAATSASSPPKSWRRGKSATGAPSTTGCARMPSGSPRHAAGSAKSMERLPEAIRKIQKLTRGWALPGEVSVKMQDMSSGSRHHWPQASIRLVAAGLGAVAGGPLGAAVGGFLVANSEA